MKTFKISFLMLFALVFTLTVTAKPKIRIIATGGTIAGVSASATSSAYSAGQVGIQTLIDAVPQIKDLAEVSGEQLVNIGSQDMNDAVWLKLAKRINQLLNKEGYVAALVDPSSKGHGVMACMNNELIDAKSLIKTHTTDCATFKGTYGEVGYVYNGKPYYIFEPTYKHTTKSEFNVDNLDKLPQVGIIYGYANCSTLPIEAFVKAGYAGIVLAGVGDGNFYKDVFDVAVQAQKNGIQIVRSSRVPTGPTCLNGEVDDSKYHFVAALNLNPQKARVLLQLALTKTHDWQQIQKYFEEY